MTIILDGNSYKYEIEAVVKIFFPAIRFNFSPQNMQDDDFCLAKMRKFKNYTYLIVKIQLKNRLIRRTCRIPTADCDSKCEETLCRMIYVSLSRITGKVSPWGMLTGIRPIKLIRKKLMESDAESAFKYFQDKFLFSDRKKFDLALNISQTQEKLLSDLPKNSFGLYVGIPFCPTRCSYCSFVSQATNAVKNLIPKYISLLCKELEETALIAKRFNLKLDTVYLGGGTPTSLSADQLNTLLKSIKSFFDFSSLREFCVEAGRPDTITREKLEVLSNHNVSRISVNPQTLVQSTLDRIGRCHSTEQFYESFQLARSLGFSNINTDLIAGLPDEAVDDFKKTLDSIINLQPEGITIHTLTIKRSSEMFFNHKANNPFASEMVEYAHDALKLSNYIPYYLYRQKNTSDNLENTGYCKPCFESLYNIYIMEECQTILATGCAGVSKIVNNDIKRVHNYKYPHEYISDFQAILKRKSDIINILENN